jgi:autotransporter strand-loop-strand O-heptosyltransferase
MSKVLIKSVTPFGDVISMTPYINKFCEDNPNDDIYFEVAQELIQFLEPSYPKIHFIDYKHDTNLFFFDKIIQLTYYRNAPLQQQFAQQLGYKYAPYIKPILTPPNKEKPIKSKYVCIGIHSTSQAKYWNHPLGKRVQFKSPYWNELCILLRKEGIVPIVIEKDRQFGKMPHFNGLPDRGHNVFGLSLEESINYVNHCEFYIGISSGMSWIAHSLGKKVAMISNFTEDWNEFDINSPDYIRITNKNVCHGCWNKYEFDIHDWYWCPVHKGTDRQFECHTSITPNEVFNQIKTWII